MRARHIDDKISGRISCNSSMFAFLIDVKHMQCSLQNEEIPPLTVPDNDASHFLIDVKHMQCSLQNEDISPLTVPDNETSHTYRSVHFNQQ